MVVTKDGLFEMNHAQLPFLNSRRETPFNYCVYGSLALLRVGQAADYINKGYLELFEDTINKTSKY